ncbi:MAG: alpha/beta hydrolase, partial [Mesorhizobium sp.]
RDAGYKVVSLDLPGHGQSPGRRLTLVSAVEAARLTGEWFGPFVAVAGHSFGGSVTTAFGREHPDKTLGLVFMAPATHPWPGGATAWYYNLTTIPIVGRLFSETLTYPSGTLQMNAATACVFAPNKVPDFYVAEVAIPLVLRPNAFRSNASDVAGLYRYTLDAAPHYRDIKAPTVVISGDRDKVVYATIHSVGLVRDIAGAELVWVHNLGHKPD